MNGLRFIRTKCNYSLSELADEIGVTRQMVSAWENGRKEIPEKRRRELSVFFRIDERFLGEISEDDKEELMHTPMYRFSRHGRQKLSYGTDGSGDTIDIDDSLESLDGKLAGLKKKEAGLLKELADQLHVQKNDSIIDAMKCEERNCDMLTYMVEILRIMNEGMKHEQQLSLYGIKDYLDALMIAYGKKTLEEVEKEVYTGIGLIRGDGFPEGIERYIADIQESRSGYEQRYKYYMKRISRRVGFYGMEDDTEIRSLLKDKYEFVDMGVFTDLLAVPADIIFIDPDSLDTDEFKVLNEAYGYSSTEVVIFTKSPRYRLVFKHYIMDRRCLKKEGAFERWIEKIRNEQMENAVL